MIVYLGGPITGLTFDQANQWRRDMEDECNERGWRALNPLRSEYGKHFGPIPPRFDGDQAEATKDLRDVTVSDVVVANLTDWVRPTIGTMIEIGFAAAQGKPVVVIMKEDDDVHDHLLVNRIAHTVVRDTSAALIALANIKKQKDDLMQQALRTANPATVVPYA